MYFKDKTLVLLIFIFFALTLHESALSQVKLVQTKVAPQIKMLIPKTFKPMDDDTMADKYFIHTRPTVIYTNHERSIDLGVNITQRIWDEKDIALLKELYMGSIQSMYTEVNFIRAEMVKINGKDFVAIEFDASIDGASSSDLSSSITNKKIYAYMQYAIYQNKIVVFNFNCPYSYKNDWQKYAEKIMQSIKIK